MTTQREIELAVLAYSSYGPSNANELPFSGWEEQFALEPVDPSDGFAASVYRNGSEYVIAFRGTDTAQLNDLIADFRFGNSPAAAGRLSSQVLQAIQLVADVMAAAPGASITFTGHSLGGGLASLMAAFFNRPAVTFDPAPFELTALSQMVADVMPGPGIALLTGTTNLAQLYFERYVDYQFSRGRGLAIDQQFQTYAEAAAQGMSALDALLTQRRVQVTGAYLRGEVLTGLRNLPYLGTFVGQLEQIDIGVTSLNESPIDPYLLSSGSMALHSMSLLTAMMAAPLLRLASQQLPTLLEEMLDESLYAADDKSTDRINFVNRLLQIQLQEGVLPGEGLIDRFAADLLRLGMQGSTRTDGILQGLIATVIEYYNYADPADTTPFISLGSNGAVFDVRRIPDTDARSGRGQQLLQSALVQQIDVADLALAENLASHATLWTVQVGANQLFTPGNDADEVQIGGPTQANDMHGGAGNDLLIDGNGDGTLDGGAGDDMLVGAGGTNVLNGGSGIDYLTGGSGHDVLIGGTDSDRLYGGAGSDDYNFFLGDGADIVLDSDGEGAIYVEGVQVQIGERIGENTWRSVSGDLIIARQPLAVHGGSDIATLVISDAARSLVVTVNLWRDGDLGLGLNLGSYPAPGETSGDITAPTTGNTDWPPASIPVGAGQITSYLDYDNLVGSLSADRMFGLGGNDALIGRDGEDYLDGGDGRDFWRAASDATS